MAVIYAQPETLIGTVPPSATIRVFRDSDQDIGYRECLLFVDGRHVGIVGHRRHLEFTVEPGKHTIHATNRVRRTEKLTFEAKAGERITFQVGNCGGAFYEFFAWIQLAIPRIFLTREESEPLQEDFAMGLPEWWPLG